MKEGRGGSYSAPSFQEQKASEWVSAGWAAGRGFAGLQEDTEGGDMFDNSHYPFNCFNYDGDGYPSSSTDEEKKICRPAYRYATFYANALENTLYLLWVSFLKDT